MLTESLTNRPPTDALASMARVLTHRQHLRREFAAAREGTRTAMLLRLLDDAGPMTSRDLADATGLPARAVRNLLAGPRERGAVHFTAGVRLWAINRDAPDPRIERAAELLRAAGWTVLPPGDAWAAMPAGPRPDAGATTGATQ